jgi:hypothetical protein
MHRILVALFAVASFAACPKGGPPTPEQAAPVEKLVRDMYTSYLGASTGNQATAALDSACSAPFVDALKAKAKACSAGTAGVNCDIDPISCATQKASLTAVVVQTMSAHDGIATAVVTPDGGAPINVRVSVSGEPWKISGVECPR